MFVYFKFHRTASQLAYFFSAFPPHHHSIGILLDCTRKMIAAFCPTQIAVVEARSLVEIGKIKQCDMLENGKFSNACFGGSSLLAAFQQQSVAVWNIDEGLRKIIDAPLGAVSGGIHIYSTFFHCNNDHILFAKVNELVVLDITTQQTMSFLTFPTPMECSAAVLSADDSKIGACFETCVMVFCTQSKRRLFTIRAQCTHILMNQACSQLVGTHTRDSYVRVWDMRSGSIEMEKGVDSTEVQRIHFADDEQRLCLRVPAEFIFLNLADLSVDRKIRFTFHQQECVVDTVNNVILVACYDVLRALDALTGEEVRNLTVRGASHLRLILPPLGTVVLM